MRRALPHAVRILAGTTGVLALTAGFVLASAQAVPAVSGDPIPAGAPATIPVPDPVRLDLSGPVLTPPAGTFVNGPRPADARAWVPGVRSRSLTLNGTDPCPDACASPSVRLAALAHGRTGSTIANADRLWAFLDGRGLAAVGNWAPPVGSLVFWTGATGGLVGTWLGGGEVLIALPTDAGGFIAARMPAADVAEVYGPYLGWAMPTKSWRTR